jgi:hypothetical protein
MKLVQFDFGISSQEKYWQRRMLPSPPLPSTCDCAKEEMITFTVRSLDDDSNITKKEMWVR